MEGFGPWKLQQQLICDVLIPTVFRLKDEKMRHALLNWKSYFIVYNCKGGYIMKSCRELYAELDYWKQYQAKNFSSSMLKRGKINQVESQIRQQIDVSNNKDAILRITDSTQS